MELQNTACNVEARGKCHFHRTVTALCKGCRRQKGKKIYVTEEGARTLDHKVKSLALYQLSYSGPCLKMSSLGCPRMIRVQVTAC